MQIRDLLVVVDSRPASKKRLSAAIELARAFDAHLAALVLVPEPIISPVAGLSLPAAILDQQREALETEAAALLRQVEEHAQSAGIAIEPRRETAAIDQWPHRLARQSRHADMTIIGQTDPDESGAIESDNLVEASFMRSGRPALIVPYIGARTLPPKHAIVCWDGSHEAAGALHDSLPLLERAKSVTLLVIDPEKLGPRLGAMPGADTAKHLARHGLNVEISTVKSGSLSVGDVILGEVSDQSADLVVMGGYGHSRLREMILGGATQRLLESMTVPVLMSH